MLQWQERMHARTDLADIGRTFDTLAWDSRQAHSVGVRELKQLCQAALDTCVAMAAARCGMDRGW